MRYAVLVLGLAAAAASTFTTDAGAAVSGRSYAAGNFLLVLDGTVAGFVKEIDGGAMVSDVVAEPLGKGPFTKKRPSPPKFDPVSLRIPLGSVSKNVFDWATSGLATGAPVSKQAALSACDYSFKEQSKRLFSNLRVSELAFPELDAGNKEAGLLRIVALADGVVEQKGSGATVPFNAGPGGMKAFLPSNFRVTMDGLDTARVSKVSAVNAKFINGKVEIANVVVTFAESSGESWRKWYGDMTNPKNASSDALEKAMVIEYLTANRAEVLLRVRLEGVGILGVEPAETVNGSQTDQISRLQAELYAESMKIEPVVAGR